MRTGPNGTRRCIIGEKLSMQNLKKFGKKLFTMSVVSMTVAWSVGLSAFVPAGAALAAPCPELEAGDLFKVSGNAAVYMVDSTGKRRFFPTELQYKTWFANFSGITTIGQECVESYAAGGSVNFRPGSYLVKSLISPSVYAVGPNNTLHKLPDEATAMALYGSNWTSKIVHTNDVFMGGYVGGFGAPVAASTPHNGMLIKKAGESTVYYVWDNVLKMVDGTVPAQAANDVRTVSAEVFGKVAMSTGSVTPSAIVSNPAQTSGGATVPTTPTSNGVLTVGLAADTAGASTIAAGTVYNNMLKVTVSATNSDVKLKGVTVTRTGLVTNANVSGVSVWDAAGNRHGDVMSSFSSDNKVTIGFGTYPIVVAKGQTTSFTVAFNLATGASSGTVGASIASAADVQTDGTVSGSFPVVGNTMSLVAGGSVADVHLDSVSAGGLSSTDSAIASAAGNLEIGQTQEVGKFRFSQSDGDSDVQVSKMTFYVQGTVKDGDLKNFEVVAPDNTVLGRTESMSDRYVTVNFDKPYTVPKSTNRVLTLRTTVADGSGNWFRIQVQNDYDVMVKDLSTGYFIAPLGASGATFSAVSSSAGYFKMKSGTVTVSKTSDTPSTSVSAGTTDTVLARFNVKAVGEDLEIRKIGLKIATSTFAVGKKELTGSVKLRVGNDILLTTSASDSTYTLYNSASTQYTLSQYLNLKSGETKVLEVLGSIPTTATSVSNFQVSVGNMYAKRLSTLDIGDIGSSSLTPANTVSVESTDVTLAKDSSLGNNTLAVGSSQVIGQYTIKAGSAEDVKLTNVTVGFAGNNVFDVPSMLQNLELWVGDVQYGSTVSTAATSSNTFLSNITIKKNEVKVIKLKALILSNASGAASSSISAYTFVGADTQNTDSDNSAVVGQDITAGSANVILSAANDNTTTNNILVPSATPVQVGKWKLEAQNESVTLKKITFAVYHALGHIINTTSSDYGTFYLYDSADMNTALGQGQYIGGSGNGYVQFSGMNLTVPANTYKFLVVKSTVNASGVMTPGMMSYLAIRSTSSTNLELVSSSGGTLSGTQLDALSSDNQLTTFGSSTVHLFHNVAPVITSVSLGSSLELSSEAPIFKYTVYNPGDREMRLGTTTVKVSASGLTGNNATTGTIDGWKLFEANANGSKGALLTSTSTCTLGGYPGSMASCWNSSATSSISVPFGTWGQNGTAMNNLTIPAGGSRTFIVTADTTEVFNGKTTGIVTVSPVLDGSTGYNFGDAAWATGVIQYYYTPVNDTTEEGPFTASDSYDVVGATLSRSL